MKLQEIENAFNRFKSCPKCHSVEGFWLGLKRDHPYVQCKGCGGRFELHEIYPIGETKKAHGWLSFLRK